MGQVIVANKDLSTGAVETISYEHHEIHSGSHYTFSSYDGVLDDTDTLEWLIVTPNTTKWAHLVWSISGALTTVGQLFESCTHTNGAAQTSYNNNRNSANTATTLIYANAGGGADGTPIDSVSFGIDTGVGSNRRSGGGSGRGDEEWLLKQNTKYLIRATSGTDGNNVTLKLSWYEHTSKE